MLKIAKKIEKTNPKLLFELIWSFLLTFAIIKIYHKKILIQYYLKFIFIKILIVYKMSIRFCKSPKFFMPIFN